MKKDNYGQMERLLDMMEHPDQYTDEQLNELLRDDELRQTYQLISDTTSALSCSSVYWSGCSIMSSNLSICP